MTYSMVTSFHRGLFLRMRPIPLEGLAGPSELGNSTFQDTNMAPEKVGV